MKLAIRKITALICFCIGIGLVTPVAANEKKSNINQEFIDGFQYEIANRSFSLMTSKQMIEKFDGEPMQIFWKSYQRLEQFNVEQYARVVNQFGLNMQPELWAEGKAYLLGLLPKIFIDFALQSALNKTKIYVDKLSYLRGIGPESDIDFLDYMVAQESLQVEMMQLALDGRYQDSQILVDLFIDKFTKS